MKAKKRVNSVKECLNTGLRSITWMASALIFPKVLPKRTHLETLVHGERKNNGQIAILNRFYHDHMLAVEPGCYLILEHLADNSEETILSNDGMLLWGNLAYNYEQASMGYSTESNIKSGCYSNRGWGNPHLVTYAESHDEERMMYKNLDFWQQQWLVSVTISILHWIVRNSHSHFCSQFQVQK